MPKTKAKKPPKPLTEAQLEERRRKQAERREAQRKEAAAAAKRAAEEAVAQKRRELADTEERIGQMTQEYEELLTTLCRAKTTFDREGWKKLDRLQAGILGRTTRRRTLIDQLQRNHD